VKKYPSFANDRKGHFRVDTKFASLQQSRDWAKDFPVNLITGRVVNMNGAGIENRCSKYLVELTPEMFADIHPDLAANHGIRNGDMIWVHAPEGTKVKVKARYSFSVQKDSLFLPFHWAGHFQGKDLSDRYPEGTKPYSVGESANTVCNYGYDIITQIPETKGGLCRIEKA
jgi:formate dehydrogenase major subunit